MAVTTVADWWLVGIAAFAAVFTAVAAISSAISAAAARDTAELLKKEADAERLRLSVRPMQRIRELLSDYTITVPDGGQERPDAQTIQREVRMELKRADLESQLPIAKEFANSTENEVALGNRAFEEIERVIAETTDEGSAFH